MTKARLGKKDSIFKSTTNRSPAAPRATLPTSPRATTASAGSAANKLTVILPPDQVAFLDRLCLDIRQTTRAKIRRTQIIRALIAALQSSKLDLRRVASEEELAEKMRVVSAAGQDKTPRR